MVALAVPAAAVALSQTEYGAELGLGAACCTVLVCFSRVYLGMHSVADILAGLLLAGLALPALLAVTAAADPLLVCSPAGPLLALPAVLLLVLLYPRADRWTPARGDTTAALGSWLGVLLAAHLNWRLEAGLKAGSGGSSSLALVPVRVMLGGILAATVKLFCKPLLQRLARSLWRRGGNGPELFCKVKLI